MQANTLEQKINLSNAKALRRTRELLKLSRSELASLMDISRQTIEKYENGRAKLDKHKIKRFISALQISEEDFKKVKKGKKLGLTKKKIIVWENSDRRSYQRIITKESKALQALRKLKKITQDNASYLCGYPRSTIGHIENG